MAMFDNDAVVWIGGAAGDGVTSAAEVLARAAARSGLHAYAHNSYQSVIRGGHVLCQLRLSGAEVESHGGGWRLLVALNQETIDLHRGSSDEGPGAGVLRDAVKTAAGTLPPGVRDYALPVGELTRELGGPPLMANIAAAGAAARLLGLAWEAIEGAVRTRFGGKKGGETAELNVHAARKGFEHAGSHFSPRPDAALKGDGRPRALMTGNQAIALGAVAGGCKFYSAYPMTPASGIMHWLAPRAARFGLVMKQCEDEISAVNMAIGASFAGARAMTGTSGGGFSLMTEAMGFAGITETPLVVAMVQRGGPSTGLPTKTEQGDLFQVLGASQGEYPKVVLAPVSVEDAYYSTIDALNLAAKWQLPVILLSDLLLSEHTETVDPARLASKVMIDAGEVTADPGGAYRRFRDTPSGVSPRALPGTAGGAHVAASDEHDEKGAIISDVFTNPSARTRMVQKRMRKLAGVLEDTEPFLWEGPKGEAAVTLVGWGSTHGVLREVRRALEDEGVAADLLQFRVLWPFHAEDVRAELSRTRRTIVVENNHSGLLARLVRQETGHAFTRHIRKFDGEPFSFGPLVAAVKAAMTDESPLVQTLVSSELDIPVPGAEAVAR